MGFCCTWKWHHESSKSETKRHNPQRCDEAPSWREIAMSGNNYLCLTLQATPFTLYIVIWSIIIVKILIITTLKRLFNFYLKNAGIHILEKTSDAVSTSWSFIKANYLSTKVLNYFKQTLFTLIFAKTFVCVMYIQYVHDNLHGHLKLFQPFLLQFSGFEE